jgi:hypothetical protein
MLVLIAALVHATVGWSRAGAQNSEILVQTSVTAGLAHHEAKAVWDQIQPGDALALTREPDNAHDPNAVRVEWKGHMLGYLPRTDNSAVARQLDRGNRLQARVVRMGQYRNHRRRLDVEVFLPLQ